MVGSVLVGGRLKSQLILDSDYFTDNGFLDWFAFKNMQLQPVPRLEFLSPACKS